MVETVAFFAPYTEHIGTEGTVLQLTSYFESQGVSTSLIRTYHEWSPEPESAGRLVELNATWSSIGIDRLPFPWKKIFLGGTTLPRLAWYLRREQPEVLVSGLFTAIAVAARDLAGVDTKVVASIQGLPQADRVRNLLWPRTYQRVESVVAPVPSIAERTAKIAEIPSDEIRIIPNPVVTDEILAAGDERPDHPWFDEDIPVLVAVGRQTRQKDFATLLRAHAEIRENRDVRLIIPGKTDEKTIELLRLQEKLNVANSVDFPGFVENPYSYMSAADVFVLSSAWEGPGHVLIEALALGTPVVSTDCPSGPRDILNDGAAGMLVPVGKPTEMASAITALLADEARQERYTEAGKDAVASFHSECAAQQYLKLCRELTDRPNHAD